jgi:hypothetical protein
MYDEDEWLTVDETRKYFLSKGICINCGNGVDDD